MHCFSGQRPTVPWKTKLLKPLNGLLVWGMVQNIVTKQGWLAIVFPRKRIAGGISQF